MKNRICYDKIMLSAVTRIPSSDLDFPTVIRYDIAEVDLLKVLLEMLSAISILSDK